MKRRGIAKAIVVWVFFLMLPILAYSESDVAKLQNTSWQVLILDGRSFSGYGGTYAFWCFCDDGKYARATAFPAGQFGYTISPIEEGDWKIEKGKIKINDEYFSYTLSDFSLVLKDQKNKIKYKFEQVDTPTVDEIREGRLIMNW